MKQRNLISKVSNLLIFAFFLGTALGDPTNSTWNYDSNGTDWSDTYSKCTNKYMVESPVNFKFNWTTYSKGGDYYLYDWSTDEFSFLPQTYKSKVGTYGFDNWVYQMSDFTNLGGIYGAEPLENPQNAQLYWQLDNIRFHHPAEHIVNDTVYDLEMQIFGIDYYKRHVVCSGKGAISIFFQIDPDGNDNPFFDWQANATAGGEVYIDLNQVLKKTVSATNNIYGYSGTDTMPGCDPVCWYVVESPLKISQAQHDFFKYQSQKSNARAIGQGSTQYTTYFFWYGAFATTPTPPYVPPTPPPPPNNTVSATEAIVDL